MLAPAAAAIVIGNRRWGVLADLSMTGFGGLVAPLLRREAAVAAMVNDRLRPD